MTNQNTNQNKNKLFRKFETTIYVDPSDPTQVLEIAPGKFFLKKSVLFKLAKDAGVSVNMTTNTRPEVCLRCAAANATKPKMVKCYECPIKAVAYKAVVSIKDYMTREKLVFTGSCELTHPQVVSMNARSVRYKNEICETRAILRALRPILCIKEYYTQDELRKGIKVEKILPNLENPEMREAILSNYRNDKDKSDLKMKSQKTQTHNQSNVWGETKGGKNDDF